MDDLVLMWLSGVLVSIASAVVSYYSGSTDHVQKDAYMRYKYECMRKENLKEEKDKPLTRALNF